MEDKDIKAIVAALLKALKGSEGDLGSAGDRMGKLKSELKESLDIQKELSGNAGAYLKYMKQLKQLNKEINRLEEEEFKTQLKVAKIKEKLKTATEDEKKNLKEILEYEETLAKLLKDRRETEEQTAKAIATQLKQANKYGAVIKGTLNDIDTIGLSLKKAYNYLEIGNAFKMQKSIKTAALQMGVLSQQAGSFSQDIQLAAAQTISFGMGIEDIAKIQSDYSEELGRTVMLGSKGAEALGQMAAATGLGVEGAAKLAGEMDSVGMSAEATAKFVQEVLNDSHALGLNASKVIKTIAGNIKLLNRYNFKDGVKGLAKMVEMTQKMGVNLDLAAPMADKLFDVEGAVEMSAQLQVLGGEWSKLADPFKLMYMARNDMAGLTKSIIEATKGSAQFNKETKQFDISALEMQRLRKVAEATGLNFEELAQSAKKAAQFSEIKKQISFDIDPKTQKFIESTAVLDENKKAVIQINGAPKLLSALTDADKKTLESMANEKESMKQRAIDATTFNEKISNTITMFKQLLVPVLDAFDKVLAPSVDKLIEKFKDPAILKGLFAFASSVGKFIGGIGDFIIKFPKLSVGIAAGLGVLFEGTKWYINGIALAKGFNSAASSGGGGAGGSIGKSRLGKMGGGALGGAVVGGLNALNADSMSEGVGDAAGGIIGGALGSLLDPFLGPFGTILGGELGAQLGGWIGKQFNSDDTKTKKLDDGVIKFNDNDKFMKVDDSTMIAGTNQNGNKDLAKMLSGGNIPALGNKSALMNGSSGGSVPSSAPGNVPSSVDVNLSKLEITGSIELKMGNNTSPEMGKQLLNDPSFLRSIAKLVNIETASAVAGKTK